MGSLIADVSRALLGLGTPVSLLAWGYVTVLLMIVAPVLAHVARPVLEPPARELATAPARAALWSAGVLAALLIATLVSMAAAIVAAPLLLVLLMLILAAGIAGYLACAWLIGERVLMRFSSHAVPVALSVAVGLAIIRLVRLVPYVGGLLHGLVVLAGIGAVGAVTARLLAAWHRRRMPDHEQFAGEVLVEWYPDGDPADGHARVATGRPVLENVRGEEDRAPRADDEDPAAR